ncbi:ribonuclease H-like domain-containing protein [Tanacetum coccineum]
MNALSFYRMETDEISERYIAPCFVNDLEAFDGEVNLAFDENMISNEFAVKLCLDYEVKKGKNLVKKELIVALEGELYFVKFIINPEEDDFEPEVILGRSFLRLAQGVVDFDNGVITIYPEPDPFEEDSEKTGKSSDDWDQLLDFNFDDVPKSGEELPLFVCKMGKSNRNKKRAMENLNLFYQDIGPSSPTGRHLTQEEAAKEELAIRISQRYALLEEERPIIETMAYNDKYKKILYEIWKDKVELDGKTVKEDEESVRRIKGEALKEKDDPGAFIFPIRLEGKVNENALADTGSNINTMPYRIFKTLRREDMKKVDRGITMINHTKAEAMGKLSNVLCQVGVTTIIVKFLILDIPIDRDAPIVVGRGFLHTMAENDSDDEEEYVIKRNKFGAPIYGPKPAPYLNFSFLGSLPVPLKQVNWKPDHKGCYTNKEEATGQWRMEIRLTDPYGNIYLQGFTTKETDQKLSKYHKLSDIMSPNLQEHTTEKPDRHDPNAQDNTKQWKNCCFHKFTMSFCYGKDVTEMQSLEIGDMLRIRVCEAASEEEFDEMCADDELQSKKIIKFRLGGRAHRGLRNDDNFNAQDYWLSISREENLSLSRSHTSTIRNLILRVIYKMITYGLCQRTTGYDKVQKNDLWLLNTTTLRDLIDSDGKLIPVDPQPGVPKVGIPRPLRASIKDLYDRIGRMEIRQDAIERMEYRQSYHWDRYHGVFEHMAGVYSIPLQEAYNPPGYAQPQYDHNYQQYPPTPPQQQQDDDE